MKSLTNSSTLPQSNGGNNENTGWTGGWANHFQYKKITFGFSGFYYFNQPVSFMASAPVNNPVRMFTTINSRLLQNIYLGYQFTGGKSASWEVYASGRNLMQNKEYKAYVGERSYYGLGVKAQF